MAQYKVLERSFIDNRIYEEGAIVEYDGDAGPNLEVVGKSKGSKNAAEDAPAGDSA